MRTTSNLVTSAALLVLVTGAAVANPRPITGYDRHPGIAPALPLAGERTLLYLNRNGGTYHSAWDDDARTNHSYAVRVDSGTIAPWSYGNVKWAQFVACMRDMYARFDIEITDIDPGSTPHLEHVVGGLPGDIGRSSGTGGVAAMNGDCSPLANGISFTFAQRYGGDVQAMCETAAQETGHTLGLDHARLCSDPMTYLDGCGPKTFQDVDAGCGEYEPRACSCPNRPTQNSVQWLYGVLGPAPTTEPEPPGTPPTVKITAPSDGATVARDVRVTAAITGAPSAVIFVIDGRELAALSAPPWSTDVHGLSNGPHVLEVIARTGDGLEGRAEISVTVPADAPPGMATGSTDGPPSIEGGCAVGGGRSSAMLVVLVVVASRRRALARPGHGQAR